jgi:hypothetical protein
MMSLKLSPGASSYSARSMPRREHRLLNSVRLLIGHTRRRRTVSRYRSGRRQCEQRGGCEKRACHRFGCFQKPSASFGMLSNNMLFLEGGSPYLFGLPVNEVRFQLYMHALN